MAKPKQPVCGSKACLSSYLQILLEAATHVSISRPRGKTAGKSVVVRFEGLQTPWQINGDGTLTPKSPSNNS